MGKISLATRMADELGVSVQKASRFIDDVGASKARQTLDEVAAQGSKTVAKWLKPATLGAGAVGGGALVWRQQDVAHARALAEQQQNHADAVRDIIESDLPPDLKRQMLEDASNAASSGGDDGGDGPTSFIPDDPQTLIILIIVMAIVLKTTLGDD